MARGQVYFSYEMIPQVTTSRRSVLNRSTLSNKKTIVLDKIKSQAK